MLLSQFLKNETLPAESFHILENLLCVGLNKSTRRKVGSVLRYKLYTLITEIPEMEKVHVKNNQIVFIPAVSFKANAEKKQLRNKILSYYTE